MNTISIIGLIFLILVALGIIGVIILFIYDKFFQKKNLVMANFPVVGRFRYVAHELRPFFRQYFGDDDSFSPRIIIDWIIHVASGKNGYFSFDKFDSTRELHDGNHQMIHSANPLNKDEMNPVFPLVGKNRKNPFQFRSYFYRSAMSLGAIGFEATQAMAAAACDAKAPFNTGEGGLSIHHIPRVKFKYQKFFKYHKVPKVWKVIYKSIPGPRLKNNFIDFLGSLYCEKNKRDLYIFNKKEFLFYAINWNAPLKDFPNPKELNDSFGHLIFQVGSGLYGLRKKTKDGTSELDFDRFAKVASFCRGIEIKLAQGAKQTGGILKGVKNTPTVAELRGVHPGIDLVSPNRFQYYKKGKEKEFFDFIEHLSTQAQGKPVGIKIVISDESNIEPIAKELSKDPKRGPNWITVDGGDGGSGTAPISLGILFGKPIFPALKIVNQVLNKYKVRNRIHVFASSKLYSPHSSARALAAGADAIGNARSIMIAGGCIRAGLCSGENGTCPVGLATMEKKNRKAYAQTMDKKIEQIKNYITAHNKGVIEVASIIGVDSPHKLNETHISSLSNKI
jgi:glutamate synthase domain-containing protein 2